MDTPAEAPWPRSLNIRLTSTRSASSFKHISRCSRSFRICSLFIKSKCSSSAIRAAIRACLRSFARLALSLLLTTLVRVISGSVLMSYSATFFRFCLQGLASTTAATKEQPSFSRVNGTWPN
eukprot:CAMPEP_0113696302 /NCGR_PEP_ID=MMETSP0038_2-20120614/21403_1 /TAXON_ID=2898 /ORGANISM="Cryptomonas paramecium" /LENGTH=121 /DNA_ID=CAMNT_0000618987 /DNA_START=216 /DNA_END=581 /DNA_ORIENTATION=- /assembly_acc=CAM_ASM_000170